MNGRSPKCALLVARELWLGTLILVPYVLVAAEAKGRLQEGNYYPIAFSQLLLQV